VGAASSNSKSAGATAVTSCQFCGQEDSTWTEEKLDLHFWQDCPMLTSCKHCEQVIEITTLNDHLLKECETANVQACTRCAEPVPAQSYAEHVKRATCLRTTHAHATHFTLYSALYPFPCLNHSCVFACVARVMYVPTHSQAAREQSEPLSAVSQRHRTRR
jgi:hypothetical protein